MRSHFHFLKEHNKEDMHIRHAYAVEAAMRGFAKHFGDNGGLLGAIALAYDIDWEEFPSTDTHPMKGGEMLTSLGYPEDFVHAVLAHGWEYIPELSPRLSVRKDSLHCR